MSEKLAIVLLNLGGPDHPAAIEPFLRNFFSDKNIIDLPGFLRIPLARKLAAKRARGEAHESYMALGGKSPLIENTEKQRVALEERLKALGFQAMVFMAMRYWHPRAAEPAGKISDFAPDKIVLLPLYPQFSTATTKSSFEDMDLELQKAGNKAPVMKICCWPQDAGFIDASCDLIRQAISGIADFRLLFSAHGLPKRTIRKGDPYQRQAEMTAEAIVKRLAIPRLDWQICYQSRVGPLEWIGPSIEEALVRAAQDKKGVVVYPHAFVSEHIETLVELDRQYKDKADLLGVPFYNRAQTVGTHPDFIAGLAKMVEKAVETNSTERNKPCRNFSTNTISGSGPCT